MHLIRCDRCTKEFKGKSQDVWLPVIKDHDEYGMAYRTTTTRDLCPDCVRGIEHIFQQCHQQLNWFLSWENSRRVRSAAFTWGYLLEVWHREVKKGVLIDETEEDQDGEGSDDGRNDVEVDRTQD